MSRTTDGFKLLRLLIASFMDWMRWALRHLYSLLILGPLILGMIYFTLARVATYSSVFALRSDTVRISLGWAFVLCLISLNLSRAAREIYHVRHPARLLEWSPVSEAAHLHFALLTRLARTFVLGMVLLGISLLWSKDLGLSHRLGYGCVFVLLITVLEVYGALNWVHWIRARDFKQLTIATAVVLLGALPGSILLLRFAGLLLRFAGLHAAETSAASPPFTYLFFATVGFCPIWVYLITRRAHQAWRYTDIDHGDRLRQAGVPNLKVGHVLRGILGRDISEMLARDVVLTLRAFSSAVYVAAVLSGVMIAFMVFLLVTDSLPSSKEVLGGLEDVGWLSTTWHPFALTIKLTCVCVCSCVGCLVPVLVHYQLPHLWLERATGLSGSRMWESKLWVARCLTLPALLATLACGLAACLTKGSADTLPLSYFAPLLLECLMLWWLVSSIAGAFAFEMPERPELAVLFNLAVSLSIGALATMLWAIGIGLYGLGISQAEARGTERAHSLLTSEAQ